MYTHCTSEQNDVDSHPQPCRPRSNLHTASLSTWPIRRITACQPHYISGSHDHFCIGIHMRSDTDGEMAGANTAESHLLLLLTRHSHADARHLESKRTWNHMIVMPRKRTCKRWRSVWRGAGLQKALCQVCRPHRPPPEPYTFGQEDTRSPVLIRRSNQKTSTGNRAESLAGAAHSDVASPPFPSTAIRRAHPCQWNATPACGLWS